MEIILSQSISFILAYFSFPDKPIDDFIAVLSSGDLFPPWGKDRVGLVEAEGFADLGGEEAIAARLARRGERPIRRVPGVASQHELAAVRREDGFGSYVLGGLRRLFRQQVNAVPLLVYWSFSIMARSNPLNCCPIVLKWVPYPPSPLQKIFRFGVRRANSAHRVLLRSNKRPENAATAAHAPGDPPRFSLR
ncbi:MAG: hypothetical protein ACFNUI_03085 [Negativicutes bacterium]